MKEVAEKIQKDYEQGVITEQEYRDALDAYARFLTGME